MRPSLLALLSLLVALGTALPPALAGEPIDLAVEDVALLPITDLHKDYLIRDHPGLVMRLAVLTKRAESMRSNLARRADPQDAAGVALAGQIGELRSAFRPLLGELVPILLAFGIPEDAFERVRRAPRGALREERYAHALALEAPGVDPGALAILRTLVPAVDGALLALHAEARRAERAGPATPPSARAAEAKAAADAIEKRFWRTVDVLLDAPQRRWIRLRLPTRRSEYADLLGHLYRLPGLTPSQGVRLKSLLVELEAATSPDTAEVRRADARLAESGVPEAERRDLERAKQAAFHRATRTKIAAVEEALRVLTPEQIAELQATPPDVTAEDRLQNPKEIVASLDLAPAQGLALVDLGRTYEDDKRRIEAEAAKIHRLHVEEGADSPRQDEMMMSYAAIQGRVQALVREATREIFLSLLSPDQVVAWVIGVER